jgi:Flagellar hook capping protein
MAIDPTSAATSGNSAATGRARLADSYETFINLLTAQLRNQDPLSPMDSTQFTQQLVQMTGVEQQLLTNDLLEKLVVNTGSGIQTSVSLLGREVRALNDEAKLTAGKAEWSYKLDRDATDVKIEVVNELGKTVYMTKATENGAGDHTFTWDGKDLSGAQLPNGGKYTLRVTAKDSAGETVASTGFIKGVVTGVEQTDGKTYITINGVQIGWERVTSISTPSEETASNDNPDNQDSENPQSDAAT